MMRLMEVVEKENLHTTNDGLEAIIFTAQGDMRQVSPEQFIRLRRKMFVESCFCYNICFVCLGTEQLAVYKFWIWFHQQWKRFQGWS